MPCSVLRIDYLHTQHNYNHGTLSMKSQLDSNENVQKKITILYIIIYDYETDVVIYYRDRSGICNIIYLYNRYK